MAKAKKPPVADGPHLAAALFCEKLLHEKDEVASIIRVVDVLTVPKPDESRPARAGEPAALPVTAITVVLIFKSGNVRGERTVKLDAVFPSGKVTEGVPQTVQFLGEENGVTVHGRVPVPVSEEGLYWFDVSVNGQRVTRMPLRIVYGKPPPADQPAPSPGSPGTKSPRPTASPTARPGGPARRRRPR